MSKDFFYDAVEMLNASNRPYFMVFLSADDGEEARAEYALGGIKTAEHCGLLESGTDDLLNKMYCEAIENDIIEYDEESDEQFDF